MRGLTIIEIASLIALGAGSRLVPHLPNMSAISAVAQKSRARFGYAGLLIPLSSMALSDLVIGFYNWRLLASVYVAFTLVGLCGAWIKKTTTRRILSVSTLGTCLFFLITNTAVWALSSWYPHTARGLMTCFAAGLPFFFSMLVGDLIFTLVVFRAARGSIFAWTKTGLMPSHF